MNTVIIPSIVEQHAEEAAFIWFLRSRAVHSPHYKLRELAKVDNRVEAHLDGLRIAGHEGLKLCEQALETGDAGEVFAASLLALESKDKEKLYKIITLAEGSEKASKGLISAIGWVEPSKLAGTVKYLLASNSIFHQRIGITACSIHRANPVTVLDNLVHDLEASPPLRARALRTAGEIKRRDLLHEIRNSFQADDASVRFWAAWSAVLLGDRGGALKILRTFVVSESEFSGRAMTMLLRALAVANSGNLLKELAQYAGLKRNLTAGSGMVGDPLYVPWLIKQMEIPEMARLAGESFSFITGADFAYEDLEGERPEGFEYAPTENAQDGEVALDADEGLPWPDPKKVQAWWNANKSHFQTGIRYLVGAPISEAQCQKVLREGFQRQRCAAALELALLKPDERLFEVRAPGWRQQRLLHAGL